MELEERIDIMAYLKARSEAIDREMEKIIPHQATSEWAERIFGKARYAYDVESLQGALNTPIWDLLDRGGKRWRPILFLLSLEAVGGDSQKNHHFSAIFEMVHNGTLMIDDIQDDSQLRRGKPCTYKIFGVDVAINAGNAMYYLPYVLIRDAKDFSPEKKNQLLDIYMQEMLNIHI
ncbi:MAG: polyprenyl synthetase family protein, partial [archaeon]|nr:polyprenyl synthetase family protein [archaeon]